MAEKVYSIKDLEVISGIKAHTIRIWEKRYHLLAPSRTGTNIRFYSDEELRRLINVASLIRRNFKISKIAGLSDEKLRELVLLPGNGETAGKTEIIEKLILHMLHFDGTSFSCLLDEVIDQSGFIDAVTEIVFPFLNKVGTFWQVGTVVPAHEHFVSELIRHRFIGELNKWQGHPGNGNMMLAFLHEEEKHDLLLLFYSVLAAKKGYRLLYLGQNVPISDLEYFSGMSEITHGLTVFTTAIEPGKLDEIVDKLAVHLAGLKIIITGPQVRLHAPSLPSGFSIIGNREQFEKLLEQ